MMIFLWWNCLPFYSVVSRLNLWIGIWEWFEWKWNSMKLRSSKLEFTFDVTIESLSDVPRLQGFIQCKLRLLNSGGIFHKQRSNNEESKKIVTEPTRIKNHQVVHIYILFFLFLFYSYSYIVKLFRISLRIVVSKTKNFSSALYVVKNQNHVWNSFVFRPSWTLVTLLLFAWARMPKLFSSLKFSEYQFGWLTRRTRTKSWATGNKIDSFFEPIFTKVGFFSATLTWPSWVRERTRGSPFWLDIAIIAKSVRIILASSSRSTCVSPGVCNH